MEARDHGIILRLRPLTETSLIVLWLTRDAGRISTVAKGARRPKSQFAGKLDLYFEADLSYSRHRQSTLHNLREVGVRDTHSLLRRELGWLHQAAYASRLIEQHTEEETPLGPVFDLFAGFIKSLPARSPFPAMILSFELKMLALLGWPPDLEKSKLGGTERRFVRALIESPWSEAQALEVERSVVRNLAQYLHGFILFHLERLPKGRAEALGMGMADS